MTSRRPYKRNIDRLRRTQGCLTDCIAYLMNEHPENVPFFVYPRQGWADRVRAFFRRRGLEAVWLKCEPGEIPKRGTVIICGKSEVWKTYAHCVVYRNGKLAYDPNYPSCWSDKLITHRLAVSHRRTLCQK